jgi:hypothetical protein
VNFEEYLISKKIDSEAFKLSEPLIWEDWKIQFEQMHPNSFTIQKLNLINPVRRKYPGKQIAEVKPEVKKKEETTTEASPAAATPSVSKPAVARPVFKPKPKIN